MHALIIEDDSLTAWLIEEELRDIGFAIVDTAATEQEALAAAERRRPDQVTSDGRLAQGTGIAAVRAIRAKSPVPVIFITGDAEQARSAEPNIAVLEKPFAVAEFVALARRLSSPCHS